MDRMTISVRPGRFGDGVAEAGLNRAVDWCYDEASAIAEHHDDAYEPSSVLVAEVDGRVVGKVELFVGFKAVHGRFGMIRRFVTHEDYRGRGVGRALLDAATARARDLGCSFIELSVDVTNPEPRAFYRREGFVEDRIEIMMRKSLDGQPHASHYLAQQTEFKRG